MSVEVQGLNELAQKMEKLGMVTADLKNDAVKAMTMVRNAARRHAPIDMRVLQSGIIVKDMSEGDDLGVGCGIFAESSINYAVYVEYGTGIYAENGQGRKTPWLWRVQSKKWADILGIEVGETVLWRGSHPHPFMRPAWDEERENVESELKKAILAKIRGVQV